MARSETWAIIHGAEREAASLDDARIMRRVLERTTRIVPESRVLVVTTERTRDVWADDLSALPASNRIDVPFERGVPASILLPFLHVFRRDPAARILVLPANHIVEDEHTLVEALLHALSSTPGRDNRAVVLGMKPVSATDPGDLILLSERTVGPTHEIVKLQDSMDVELRAHCIGHGALVDSMIFAANTSAMLRLYDHALPGMFRSFLAHLRGPEAWPVDLIERLYRFLPRVELARDLFAPSAEILRALPVDPCGFIHLEQHLEAEEALENEIIAAAQEGTAVPQTATQLELLGARV